MRNPVGILFHATLILIALVLTASAAVDVKVTDFGAVANDLVDDTAGIQAALNFAGANGGGVVRFPAGRFRLAGRATVPDKVDLLGAGMTATTITCTASAACIAFGDREAHATVPQGGKSGHFFINGNSNAANPVYVGHQQGRTLERIKVLNAADVGLKIEEAQRSRFFALHVAQSANVNVTIDFSASALGFYDCIFSGAGQHGVRILQSGVSLNASGNQCSQIRFLGGLIEAIGNGGAAFLIEAGTDIVIDSMGTSGSDVRIARAANRRVQRVTLRATELQAATSGVRQNVGLEVTGGSINDPIQVFLESGVYFRGGDYPIVTDDGALIHALNYYQSPALTNLWRNLGGTKTIEQGVRDLGRRQASLTVGASATIDATYDAQEAAMIANVRARLNELELRLERAGIIHPGQSFATWAATWSLTGSAALPLATPADDGIPNLLKFAARLNPNATATMGDLFDTTLSASGDANFVTVVFRRNREANGVSYGLQSSRDLFIWNDEPLALTIVNPDVDGDGIAELVEAVFDWGAAPQGFIRLKASQ